MSEHRLETFRLANVSSPPPPQPPPLNSSAAHSFFFFFPSSPPPPPLSLFYLQTDNPLRMFIWQSQNPKFRHTFRSKAKNFCPDFDFDVFHGPLYNGTNERRNTQGICFLLMRNSEAQRWCQHCRTCYNKHGLTLESSWNMTLVWGLRSWEGCKFMLQFLGYDIVLFGIQTSLTTHHVMEGDIYMGEMISSPMYS